MDEYAIPFDPARVRALKLWTEEVRALGDLGPTSFTEHFPAPPAGVSPNDYEEFGFGFINPHLAYWHLLDPRREKTLHIVFSPSGHSQAVLLKAHGDWTGSLMWVDGHEVPVPRARNGDPLIDDLAWWRSDRFLVTKVGGLWDHPFADPMKFRALPLGWIRGVLLWDNLKRQAQVFLPLPTEAWTDPKMLRQGDSWHIYADEDAYKQHRADRVIPVAE